jgi:hypothetical protein
MTELEQLAAQLRVLTEAVDRLTDRIDALGTGVALDARPDPDADPYAWPSEEELVRYLAGRAPGVRP